MRLSSLLTGMLIATAMMTSAARAQVAHVGRDPMLLGVATHFDQNWPLTLINTARTVRAASIRDDLPWAKGEPALNRYDLSPARVGFILNACRAGMDVLLFVDPRHPLYDGGKVAYSPKAQAAYAKFVKALLDRTPTGCIAGIEVGNEINADGGLPMPAGVDPIKAYVALLRAVHGAIKSRHPAVAIVGGSTNAIGIGFLDSLAAAGALEVMDAVAVHPYRSTAENVDWELERLSATLAGYGKPMPIWATEFGDYFATPDLAVPHLIKMAMLMGAAGVRRSYWYLLVDEPWFKNMGLYDGHLRPKPASDAFRLAQGKLLQGGPPVRIDAGDRRSFVFKLASGGYVLWGAPRAIGFTGPASAVDARGHAIALPASLSAEPVILSPGAHFTLGTSDVLADSLYEFGHAPWSYLARSKNTAPVPLSVRDWQWTSYFTAAGTNPLAIGASGVTPSGEGANGIAGVIRYTTDAARTMLISACITKKKAGDGVDLRVSAGGKLLLDTIVEEKTIVSRQVALAAGETLDFAIGPNQSFGDDATGFRIRLLRPQSTMTVECGT